MLGLHGLGDLSQKFKQLEQGLGKGFFNHPEATRPTPPPQKKKKNVNLFSTHTLNPPTP